MLLKIKENVDWWQVNWFSDIKLLIMGIFCGVCCFKARLVRILEFFKLGRDDHKYSKNIYLAGGFDDDSGACH